MTDNPITREEQYLAYLNGSGNVIPSPITRVEKYLYELCMNGISGGGTAQSKKFELIEEIIVEGDEVKVIERSKEPNGATYSFEEVLITFEMNPSNVANALLCYANNLGVSSISDLINTTKQYTSLRIDVSKGILLAEYQAPAPAINASGIVRTRNLEVRQVDFITSLKFSCGASIPAGSKIAIYGIRK